MYKFDEDNINFQTLKQPNYEDQRSLKHIENELLQRRPIANIDRISKLLDQLSKDDSLILQIGDCAEPIFESTTDMYYYAMNTEKFISKLAGICSINYPNVIKIGRIAGQFAKPRSQDTETRGGKTLPIYMGDVVNKSEFSEKARKPQPDRMLMGYEQAKYIYNLNLDFFTSHEALLMPYEKSLMRTSDSGIKYLSSADTVWIGNKTRFVGSNHIELLRDIANPIGIKLGSDYMQKEIDWIYQRLNPMNLKEKLMFTVRFGQKNIKKTLKELLEYLHKNSMKFNILCDPLHGNTFVDSEGKKRRNLDDVIDELIIFKNLMNQYDIRSYGIHLEATFDQNIQECTDNFTQDDDEYDESSLLEDYFYKTKASIFSDFFRKREPNPDSDYNTLCDPRLNNKQTLKLIADFLG